MAPVKTCQQWCVFVLRILTGACLLLLFKTKHVARPTIDTVKAIVVIINPICIIMHKDKTFSLGLLKPWWWKQQGPPKLSSYLPHHTPSRLKNSNHHTQRGKKIKQAQRCFADRKLFCWFVRPCHVWVWSAGSDGRQRRWFLPSTRNRDWPWQSCWSCGFRLSLQPSSTTSRSLQWWFELSSTWTKNLTCPCSLSCGHWRSERVLEVSFCLFLVQKPPLGQGLLIHEISRITHNDVLQSVGLLWTSDKLVAESSIPDNTQHSQQTNIHDPVGF